ncbi:hypothetical protein N7532_006246 [Penicillium argentinense]|uniref:Uncharacterized protein n=1 Tax=Penicillium argentinense TaxID=1131581 RepID=A0A9W9FFF6_9EURO|nr:uncharacterized protein N7532_006246 [Penicillium argentinense]KAJ5099245.1 hypothetical protein N7532_006246 [Penicillium argentinense]
MASNRFPGEFFELPGEPTVESSRNDPSTTGMSGIINLNGMFTFAVGIPAALISTGIRRSYEDFETLHWPFLKDSYTTA